MWISRNYSEKLKMLKTFLKKSECGEISEKNRTSKNCEEFEKTGQKIVKMA